MDQGFGLMINTLPFADSNDKIIDKTKQAIELINADVILEKLDNVVSSDAVIIDKCISYFNLSREIIEKYIYENNIIYLNKY